MATLQDYFRRTGLVTMLVTSAAVAAPQRDPRPEPPVPASSAAHYARAREIASTDRDLQYWFAHADLCMSPQGHDDFAAKISSARMAPVQVADNLYLVGTGHVNSWILKTSAGIVLFDTLNNTQEAQELIEAGMRHFGLNPADIKYIFLTHGHADHWGGAKYFQDKYHVHVATSDWEYLTSQPERAGGPEKPTRDIELTDGQIIRIGDANIQLVTTPGHTLNTASYIFPVKVNGVAHNFAMWGGTNFPRNQLGLATFHNSLHRFWDAANRAHADSLVNPHAFFFDAFPKIEAMKTAKVTPFLMGDATVQKTLAMMDECFEAEWGWFAALDYK